PIGAPILDCVPARLYASVRRLRLSGPRAPGMVGRGRRNPLPPGGDGPPAHGWSPAATGQRTRAAWFRDPSPPSPAPSATSPPRLLTPGEGREHDRRYAMRRLIKIYDTTLRDGTQGEGVSFSMEDKVRLATRLDALGIHYIEGGWPGSNPKAF